MSFSVTNQRSAPAFKGTSVLITLNEADSAQLGNMTIGQQCTLSNGKVGFIDFIDLYGHVFKIKPNMPTEVFMSIANLGHLMAGVSVTVVS